MNKIEMIEISKSVIFILECKFRLNVILSSKQKYVAYSNNNRPINALFQINKLQNNYKHFPIFSLYPCNPFKFIKRFNIIPKIQTKKHPTKDIIMLFVK